MPVLALKRARAYNAGSGSTKGLPMNEIYRLGTFALLRPAMGKWDTILPIVL